MRTAKRIKRRMWFALPQLPAIFVLRFLSHPWDDYALVWYGLWAGTGMAWWIMFPVIGDKEDRRGYFRYVRDNYRALQQDADSARG